MSEDDTPSFPPPSGPPFVPPSDQPDQPDQPGSRRRRGWLIGGALAVLALAGGLLALLVTRGDGDGAGSPPQSSVPEITFPLPPTTTSSTLPDLPDLSLPTLPDLSLPTLPDFTIPDLPDLSLPDLPDLSFPEFTIPETTVPDLIPPPTLEPDGLGTDAALDELAQECYDAEMQSCDDLYEQAPADSDYEAYGDTCAGRQPEQTRRYCSDVFGG